MKRILALILAFLVASLGMTALAEGSPRTDLRLATAEFPTTLDPHKISLASELAIVCNIYEPLVHVDGKGEQHMMLAESYELSEDNLTYTFKLRQGVKFHNGDVMTADDVVYSVERAMESSYMITYVQGLESVEKIDDATVALHLSTPYAPFLMNFSTVKIVDKAYAEAEGDGMALKPNGTGPYVLSSFENNIRMELTAFEDYWQESASIKTVAIDYISDAATQVIAFESGDIDFIGVPSAEWMRISAEPSYKSGLREGGGVTFLTMNSEVAPLNDVRVRQAISMAVNKDNVILMAKDGVGKKANVLANPATVFGATEDCTYYDYDLEGAKALLAEAGYPNGVDIGSLMCRAGSADEKIAQVVAADLSMAGISCTIEIAEASSVYSNCFSGNYTISTMGAVLGNDYSVYGQLYTTPYLNNLDLCRYQNEEVDALFADGIAASDPAERQEIYKQAIEIVESEALYVPLFYSVYPWACDPDFNPVYDGDYMHYYDCSWN